MNLKLIFSVIVGILLTTACRNTSTNLTHDSSLQDIVNNRYKSLALVLDGYVSRNEIAGGVGLVFEKGDLVFHHPFGYKNIENKEPFELTDIFRIASMTKPVTSVAAMKLYEQGKFKLDDPVSMYIPEFENLQVLDKINRLDSTFTAHPATKTMTIRHLFTHTSGLFYGYDNDTLNILYTKAGISEGFEERDILLADNVRKLAQLPVLHEPGEQYTYGLSIDVLGRLVEIWSGMPLDKYLMDSLFRPLGMNDTYFYLPEDKYNRLVPVYMSTDNGVAATNYPFIYYPVRGAKKFLSGGADLSCTTYDYYLFCRMMLQGGELKKVRILKPETIDMIASTQFETGDNDMGLGFGFLSEKSQVMDARSVGSYFWGGFFTTIFWIDPAEEVIGILMLQMYPFDNWKIYKDFEDGIYKAVDQRENE